MKEEIKKLEYAGEIWFFEKTSMVLFRDPEDGMIYRRASINNPDDAEELRDKWQKRDGRKHIIASSGSTYNAVFKEVEFRDFIKWANEAVFKAQEIWFPEEAIE